MMKKKGSFDEESDLSERPSSHETQYKLPVTDSSNLLRKGTISSQDVQQRFSASAGLGSLEHNIERQLLEKKFLDLITQKIREALTDLKLEKVNAQVRNCINVIEYLRRVKGVAMVGPVCTGKTQILKIVAKVLQLAYGINMRTSVVNSEVFSFKELYGATEAFQK